MDSTLIFIVQLACLIPAIVFHEVAHGYVAYRLGDPTAKALGRLTLNPIKHVDPFGTVLLPGFLALMGAPVFGYAKPVPYNPQNFVNSIEGPVTRELYYKTLRKGELLVGLAGPATNFVLALAGALVAFSADYVAYLSVPVASALYLIGAQFALINLVLMFFNLLPLPPLDGSSIIAVFLPAKAMGTYYKLQQYSFPILLGVMFLAPRLLGFDVIGWYFDHTAYALAEFLLL